jgi:hypothetical protein
MDILGALGFPRSKKTPPLFKPRSRSFSLPENRYDPTQASLDIVLILGVYDVGLKLFCLKFMCLS